MKFEKIKKYLEANDIIVDLNKANLSKYSDEYIRNNRSDFRNKILLGDIDALAISIKDMENLFKEQANLHNFADTFEGKTEYEVIYPTGSNIKLQTNVPTTIVSENEGKHRKKRSSDETFIQNGYVKPGDAWLGCTTILGGSSNYAKVYVKVNTYVKNYIASIDSVETQITSHGVFDAGNKDEKIIRQQNNNSRGLPSEAKGGGQFKTSSSISFNVPPISLNRGHSFEMWLRIKLYGDTKFGWWRGHNI